uniref:DNA excision repair protein ERCC-6-like n=1 Tax=Erpetoichthys calabaricus TaxID=27687 RepID=A0A8C4T4D9_ERPCA
MQPAQNTTEFPFAYSCTKLNLKLFLHAVLQFQNSKVCLKFFLYSHSSPIKAGLFLSCLQQLNDLLGHSIHTLHSLACTYEEKGYLHFFILVFSDIGGHPEVMLCDVTAKEEMKNQRSGKHYLESGFWIKEDLYTKLYEYQKEGVSFLYSLYKHGKGGLLADDMGLGKTVQIIAFLSGVINMKPKESVLLVVPCSLMTNWADTFKAWTPNLQVKIFHGSEKNKQLWNLEEVKKQGGVLITSYGTMVSKLNKLSFCNGEDFIWDIVIFDEAHTIKTPNTETCQSACSLPSKIRILITGTPVQNNLREMWTLFNVACQGAVLGTYKTFKHSYENPIMSGRVKNASPRKSTLALKCSESLMSMISPYYMRRTKEILPCLSKKNDLVVWLRPTQLQSHKYKSIIATKVQKDQLTFPVLCKLKKVCDHPRLLFPFVVNELDEEGAGLAQESSKLLFLVPLLRKLCAEGNRTLVFSHSSKMLDIIQLVLTNNKFCYLRMDGTVTISKRQRLVEAFQTQSDYSIFLLTTQVGGVGLNLTAANRVVIFDPSWTPADDAQAIDRIYRIGQEKDVIVYRLITCGTVEEKIYCRQVFKDSLMRQATGDEKNPFRHFTREELGNIFTLGNTRSSSTRIQLQSRSTQVTCDTKLDEHIEFLHSLDIDGISHHNLLFTISEEDMCSSEDNESILDMRDS